ncbi:hypothetical protein BGX27_005488 [Mortierella sp. AM989]|nr:hypothetical protein BGX27_005488 [Mortierella sp. AM989]
MAAPQIAFLSELLQSIPHPFERPRPQGIQALQNWARLLLDLILHPNQWHKLGFAVQWAKWIEWEGGLDLKSPVRSPGILYLQNPLHPFALNNLLNQLEFSLVDIETLIGCVDTGDWTCLLKEGEQADAKLRGQVSQSLEHLCLLSFYLRNGLASLSAQSSLNVVEDQKEQSDNQLVQDLVSRILKDETTTTATTTSTPINPIWRQAFSEQALRLTAQQDPNNAQLPSKLSVILNEVLEVIRLNKIRQDGWIDPTVSDKLSDTQFQQLGKLLSTSFFTIIEYANVSLFLPVENIAFLSRFAAQLPASWYSDDFLRTTIQMAKRYLSTEKLEKFRVPSQIQGLVAISTLWSYWMRKTGSGDVNILGQELNEIMAEILATPSLLTGLESKGIFSACFSGLATGLDKWSGLMEPKIIQGMVSGLEHGRVIAQDVDLDGIQAGLATVLRSNALDQSPESIKKLVKAFLEAFYGSSNVLVVSTAVSNVDELLQVQRLFQFVVTYKAGLVPVKDNEDTKKKRKKRKAKKAINLKEFAWFEALISGVQDISEKGALPSLLAVAGILRTIQHAEDDPPKVDAESLALVQDLFVTKLKGYTELLKPEGSISMLSPKTQACIVFIASQTIPNLPSCKLETLECSVLANLLVDYILQPNEGVVPVNEILRVASYEIAQERNRLSLNGTTHQLLNKTVKGPIFPEMGRVARAVATLIEKMQDWQEIEGLLQRMHSFAINIHVDWSRCGLSKADSFLDRKEGEPGLDSETSKTLGMLFQVFKTILFAYTMIFGSVSEKASSAAVSVGLIAQLDYLMLDSYAYLYFVTYKLGPGSFQVYEELITSILTRMVTSEELTAAQQLQIERQNGNDDNINRHILLNKTIKNMMPRAEFGFYDPVMESRTLFFMNLLERLMVAIEENLLEHHLLPLVYPYLLKNDQRDLFESAHSVIMSVFLTNKKIAKQLAPFYTNLLLQHYPDQINIDQLRAAFTTMIKSLSETEDALAWLCVEKLLERIQHYDELAEAEVDSLREDAVALLKKEQLNREKEKALVEVATTVHQDLNPKESPSHLPSLGTLTPPTTDSTTTTITPSTSSKTVSSSSTTAKSLAILERQKQRGELLLALFDQLSSLNLIFVETLGDKIRGLLAKEQSLVGRKALLKCILDVVGGSAVDHTKRDWAVKWYLGLVNEFGHNLPSPSSPSSPSQA